MHPTQNKAAFSAREYSLNGVGNTNPPLHKKMLELAAKVQGRDDFVVVHHYDADGCTSGAIMYRSLERAGHHCRFGVDITRGTFSA